MESELPVGKGRENLCVRAFERLHPADGFTFRIRSEIPLVGRARIERRGDRGGADGGRPPVRAGRRPAGAGLRARGPPRQRRGGAAGRVRRVRRRAGDPVRPADGLGGAGGRARATGAHARGARSAAGGGAAGRGRVQRCARSAVDAGPGQGGLGPARARAARPPARAATRGAVPALVRAGSRARASWERSGRRSPEPGPTVLVWCFYEQTGAVAEALGGEIEGWATRAAGPFESQGAYVGRALSELGRRARRASRRARPQPPEHLAGQREVVRAEVGPVVEDRASPARPTRRRRSRRARPCRTPARRSAPSARPAPRASGRCACRRG